MSNWLWMSDWLTLSGWCKCAQDLRRILMKIKVVWPWVFAGSRASSIVLIKGEGARVGTRRPIRGQDPGHMITLDQSDPGTGNRNCN